MNVCFWVILKAVCQALGSKINISLSTSEWLHIFIIAIMTAQKITETADLVTFTEEILNEKIHFLCSEWQQNCFILFNNKTVYSSSYIFFLTIILKNSKTVLKPRKNTDFFCLKIYLKEEEPGLCSIVCEPLYYLGKARNVEEKY